MAVKTLIMLGTLLRIGPFRMEALPASGPSCAGVDEQIGAAKRPGAFTPR
jgi:hypothetical protein